MPRRLDIVYRDSTMVTIMVVIPLNARVSPVTRLAGCFSAGSWMRDLLGFRFGETLRRELLGPSALISTCLTSLTSAPTDHINLVLRPQTRGIPENAVCRILMSRGLLGPYEKFEFVYSLVLGEQRRSLTCAIKKGTCYSKGLPHWLREQVQDRSIQNARSPGHICINTYLP